WVGSTTALQPKMPPSSVANRKRLGAATPFLAIAKPAPSLKTVPVGLPSAGRADGIVTTSGTGCPRPSRRSETPLPLSPNQKGPVGLKAMPQGLTRFGSVTRAHPGTFEARLTWAKPPERRQRSSRHSRDSRDGRCRADATFFREGGVKSIRQPLQSKRNR